MADLPCELSGKQKNPCHWPRGGGEALHAAREVELAVGSSNLPLIGPE